MMEFLATATLPGLEGNAGMSWWQTVGGLLAVFALLIIFLKVLGRFQGGARQDHARILAVWNLGPRREIQVLRLGEEIHYIYRHDGAMVLLKQDSYAAWQASGATAEQPRAAGLPTWLKDRLPALAGSRAASGTPLTDRR
ncbi:MAG: hypothetical protein GY838_07065 [bacterium]|nr:hypothetical protein [bacterium]